MAINLYDVAYGLGLGIAAPWWFLRPVKRQKVLGALRERMGRSVTLADSRRAVFIHAVSNGELNATTRLVQMLAERRPDLRFVISTTSESGWARSGELYGHDPRVMRIRYPLDFSRAVSRVLANTTPAIVVLMELELWPNFVGECRARGIPVMVANGRITRSSLRGYRILRPLVGQMFRYLAFVCAQEEQYAERFLKLGAARDRIEVVGTMKFDSAHLGDRVEGDEALAADLGIDRANGSVWVCGSTGPGEESVILESYRSLIERHATLRLVIVPRHKPRFDEVADLIAARGFAIKRRSHVAAPSPSCPNPVILGDTMGELRKFYSLATVVLVGRSLVDLGPRQHGSDMIEPAALGKPVVVGPFSHNFAEPMNFFLAADAIRVVGPRQLTSTIDSLLRDPKSAIEMGLRAKEVVRRQQGATEKHVQIILDQLDRKGDASRSKLNG